MAGRTAGTFPYKNYPLISKEYGTVFHNCHSAQTHLLRRSRPDYFLFQLGSGKDFPYGKIRPEKSPPLRGMSGNSFPLPAYLPQRTGKTLPAGRKRIAAALFLPAFRHPQTFIRQLLGRTAVSVAAGKFPPGRALQTAAFCIGIPGKRQYAAGNTASAFSDEIYADFRFCPESEQLLLLPKTGIRKQRNPLCLSPCRGRAPLQFMQGKTARPAGFTVQRKRQSTAMAGKLSFGNSRKTPLFSAVCKRKSAFSGSISPLSSGMHPPQPAIFTAAPKRRFSLFLNTVLQCFTCKIVN